MTKTLKRAAGSVVGLADPAEQVYWLDRVYDLLDPYASLLLPARKVVTKTRVDSRLMTLSALRREGLSGIVLRTGRLAVGIGDGTGPIAGGSRRAVRRANSFAVRAVQASLARSSETRLSLRCEASRAVFW